MINNEQLNSLFSVAESITLLDLVTAKRRKNIL